MGLLGDVFGGVGDAIGNFTGGGTDDAAKKFYLDQISKMGGVDPRIQAQQSGPSALGGAGMDSRAAQMDALREMQNTYRSGGLDANTRAGLAEATTSANRNAAAQGNQIQEQARSQNMGRSGVALALQQQAGQNAMQNQNLQALGAAGVAQQNRQGAQAGAGALGGQVRGQDYQAAGAQDAINQFNAMMRQGAAQSTYGNQMGQLGAETNAYGGVYGAGKSNEDRIRGAWRGIGKTVGSIGDAAAAAYKPDQTGNVQP